MKNIKLLSFVLIVLLAFTGCSSDDDGALGGHFGDDGSEETRFTGSWRLDSAVADREIDFNGDGYATKFLFEFEMDNCEKLRKWIFNKRPDGKLAFNIYPGERGECSKDTKLMWEEWVDGALFNFKGDDNNTFIIDDEAQTEVHIDEFKKDEKLVLSFDRLIGDDDVSVVLTLIPHDAPYN